WAFSCSQLIIVGLFISLLVPMPPGTTRMSGLGQLSKLCVGSTRKPPRAVIVWQLSATVETANGVSPSLAPVTVNTSKGPQKSSTSTSSNMTMQTWRCLSSLGCVFIMIQISIVALWSTTNVTVHRGTNEEVSWLQLARCDRIYDY